MEQHEVRRRTLGQPALRQIQQRRGPRCQQLKRRQHRQIARMHARQSYAQQSRQPRAAGLGLRKRQALVIGIARLMV